MSSELSLFHLLHLKISPLLPERWQAQTSADISTSQGDARAQAVRLAKIATRPIDNVLVALETQINGLTVEESTIRQEQFGANQVVREEKKGIVRELLELLINPLNILLLVLMIVNFAFIHDIKAGVMVAIMVALSIALSYIQENRSSDAAAKLRTMVGTTATVVRPPRLQNEDEDDESTPAMPSIRRMTAVNEEHHEIPIADLVPGDIIALSAGDIIPADVRILSARDLFLNQAALTGESLPVEKHASMPAGVVAQTTDILGLPTLAFMGSHVTSGTARAVVVTIGDQTWFGRIARTLTAVRQPTDFEKGVARFTWVMIRFILVMAPLVFLINGLSKGNWTEAVIFALAVAVGLTPEMLPMIVTVNLSKGALVMARKQVIVKRLNVIQNLGAMDVLCTDKTGTLTQDKVIVKRHVDLAGEECEDVLRYAYLNSYYQTGLRNLLDVAVLEHAEVSQSMRIDEEYQRIDEIPFDFVRRRMSVVVERSKQWHILICKGAVEEVLQACTNGEHDGRNFVLDATHRAAATSLAHDLNRDGFRVVAVAHRDMPPSQETYSVQDEAGLTLVGFIAFLDPPRDSAAPAIAALAKHGVSVKILTGDNDIVTHKICRDVDLAVTGTLLGHDIAEMSDAELDAATDQTNIFAKLAPEQKARVIASLHRRGHVVGFLGDGINDGPALRTADVGISVDSAVDIARESADIILLQKSLMVLEEGVLEGRRVFGNIMKYLRIGSSSNFGNMFSVLGASAWLPFLPMAPIQVLANNLLYDFSQVAIPTDNIDHEYLREPRRWNMSALVRFMLIFGPLSSCFDYLMFAFLYFVIGAQTIGDAATFQTGWFIHSLLSQTLIVHVIRTGHIPFIESRASWPMIITTLFICSTGLWLPFSPFAASLGFIRPHNTYWVGLIVLLLIYLVLVHFVKVWFLKKFGWR